MCGGTEGDGIGVFVLLYIVILKYLLPFAESFTGDTQWMNPVTMVTGLSDGGGFSSIFLFFSEDVILAS